MLGRHPHDHRYLEYRGKPIIPITSGEDCGSVLNLDFDYDLYLETLAADGLNDTRVFTGIYVERASSFGIEKNTLAPARGRLIVPWARSFRPGYVNGGNRFDLEHWDPQYFARLKDFVGKADAYGIIVEVTRFSSTYADGYWEYSPLKPANNINLEKPVERKTIHTLDNGPLLAVQEKLTRKLVREFNEFNDTFFEIKNEPYAGSPGHSDAHQSLSGALEAPMDEPSRSGRWGVARMAEAARFVHRRRGVQTPDQKPDRPELL